MHLPSKRPPVSVMRPHLKQKRALMIMIIVIFGLCLIFSSDLVFSSGEQEAFLKEWMKFQIELPTQEANKSEKSEQQLCSLPDLNPFDPEIMRFIHFPVPVRCKYRVGWLTFVDSQGMIRFNDTAWEATGYSRSSLRCTMQSLRWKNDFELDMGPTVPIIEPIKISSEFVLVECRNFLGIVLYMNVHFFVQQRQDLKTRTRFSPNILFFGIDSVSRSNFIRQLPKTYKYLVSRLNFTVLDGFTKVADNTFPNLIPLLTGLPSTSPLLGSLKSFNDWPLIWKNFSSAGYVTLFAEDYPQLNTFTYANKGFDSIPSDHYIRPYWIAVESTQLHMLSSHLCFGPEAKHILHLQYLNDFISKYLNIPFFAFSFLTELSHNYLNQVGAADQNFLDFFQIIHKAGFLNDTIVVVFADHGHRFDSIRSTKIGRLEDNLPFCAVYIPPRVQDIFPTFRNNLNINKRRLTSHFDLHASLLHILNIVNSKREIFHDETPGRSLFLPISLNRKCEEAGIPPEYCSCEVEKNMDVVDFKINKIAEEVVYKINTFTKTFRQLCSAITVNKIISVVKILKNFQNCSNDQGKVKMRMTVETIPGKGIFEALIEINEIRRTIKVFEHINRVNEYGSQADCLTDGIISGYSDVHLRKYCYCIK